MAAGSRNNRGASHRSLAQKFATQHGDGLATEQDAFSLHTDTHDTTAGRGLISHRVSMETLRPERPDATVG